MFWPSLKGVANTTKNKKLWEELIAYFLYKLNIWYDKWGKTLLCMHKEIKKTVI
jgi:hypothetical protein